jgi:hypothetical protein
MPLNALIHHALSYNVSPSPKIYNYKKPFQTFILAHEETDFVPRTDYISVATKRETS